MIESGMDVPFLPHTSEGVEKIHPPRRGRTSGVNEFPSRHVRPVHYIYLYRIPIFESCERDHTTSPPSLLPLFVLHIRNADGLLFFDPVRNFTTAFLSFSFFQPSFRNSIRLLCLLPVLENTPRFLAG